MGLSFSTSLSGLLATQRQMQVGQNNIANANTEGYARQRLHLEANTNSVGGGRVGLEIGSGVITQYVERLKDEMLIEQARNEQGEIGYYDEITRILSDIEVVFGEGKEGSISNVTASFFNALEELNKFPEESSYRLTFLGEAERFASKIQSVYLQMEDLKTQMDGEVDNTVLRINTLTENIAKINKQINEQPTDHPNALMDQRDRYLDELSTLIDVKVAVDKNNPKLINVSANDVFLVSGEIQNSLTKMEDKTNNERIFVANGSIVNPQGGKMAAQIKLESEYIPKYVGQLNDWVKTMTNEMNAVHADGFGLDGSTGLNLFSGTTAGSIAINDALKKDPSKLAISAKGDTPGNNDNGKLLAEIRDKKIFNGNTTGLENFYKGIVLEMATELNVAEDNAIVHSNVLTGIETQKQQLQGVNVDEEMTNLLQYQQSYTANAKMIKAVDDALSQLFGVLG